MGWLDELFSLQWIDSLGNPLKARQKTRVLGPGAPTFADNPTLGTTDATFPDPSGGGGGGFAGVVLSNGLNSNIPTAGKTVLRVTGPTGAFSVGGFAPGTSWAGGNRVLLSNTTTHPVTLVHEDTGSTASNRISLPYGSSVVVPARPNAIELAYDATIQRFVLAHSGFRYDRVFDVRDFGAKGDGVADDTAAIQAAIIAAGRGGTVYFPQNPTVSITTYNITSTLMVDAANGNLGIEMLGQGPSSDSTTLYQPRLLWIAGPAATGTTATIASIANDQYGQATLVTLTGCAGLTANMAGATIAISNATSLDPAGFAVNNGNFTIVSVNVSAQSLVYRCSNQVIGAYTGLPIVDANVGHINWTIHSNLLGCYTRGVTFRNLSFHGVSQTGALVDIGFGTDGTPCTNIQFYDCCFLNSFFGAKVGDYGGRSTQPPGNCDLFRFQKCYFSGCSDTAVLVPNKTGQSKAHIYEQCAIGSGKRGLRYESGSFRCSHVGFGQMTEICAQAVNVTDVISLDECDVENTPRLFATGRGLSGGINNSPWPVSITNLRYDFTGVDASADGYVIQYTDSGGLSLRNCEFSYGVGGFSTDITVAISGTGPRSTSAIFENCYFPNPNGNIVTRSGPYDITYYTNGCENSNGTTRTQIADGYHYVPNGSLVGAPTFELVNVAIPGIDVTFTAGTINDALNPFSSSVRALSTGDFTLTGIATPDNGQVVDLHNGSGHNMTLAHEAAGSAAGNRFHSPSGADVVFPNGYVARIKYESASSRWLILNPPVTSAAPSGAAGGDLGGSYPNPTVVSVASVATGTLSPGHGGTGVASPTAHAVLVGEGSSPVTSVGPGTSGLPLVSGGASADPSFTALGVAGGGTGATTLTAHAVLVGEGTSLVAEIGPGASGVPLLGGGVSADPAFGALNLGGGASIVTGTLPTSNQAAQALGGSLAGTTAAGTVLAIDGTGGVATLRNGVKIQSAGSSSGCELDLSGDTTDGLVKAGPSGFIGVSIDTASGVRLKVGQTNATGISCAPSTLWLGIPDGSVTNNNFSVKCDGSNLRLNAPSGGGTIDMNLGNTSEYRFAASFVFPFTDGGPTLGLSNQRWATAYTLALVTGSIAGSSGTPVSFTSSSIALTNVNVVLSAAQMATPHLVLTGTMTGNVTITFPNAAGVWMLNVKGLTIGANVLTLASGSDTQTFTAITGQNLFLVATTGANGISIG